MSATATVPTTGNKPKISPIPHAHCDVCGAVAYYNVSKPGVTGELLFCAHHARSNELKLRDDGWTFNPDDTSKDAIAA